MVWKRPRDRYAVRIFSDPDKLDDYTSSNDYGRSDPELTVAVLLESIAGGHYTYTIRVPGTEIPSSSDIYSPYDVPIQGNAGDYSLTFCPMQEIMDNWIFSSHGNFTTSFSAMYA